MNRIPPAGTRVYVMKRGINRVLTGVVIVNYYSETGIVAGDGYASLINVAPEEIELVAIPSAAR